jgi:Restriction endonuclease S subunits
VRSTKSRFYPSDVLYGKLRPYLDKAAVAEWSGVCSTDILALVPKIAEADSYFLGLVLHTQQFLAHAIATTSGVNHPRTSWRDIAAYTLRVPPLEAQRVIASILRRQEEAIQVEDQRIALLSELKAATMSKVFREGIRGESIIESEFGTRPASWRVRPLGALAAIGNGSTPSRQNPAYWTRGTIPWITSTKVHDVIVRSADEYVTTAALDECHLPMVATGSLVIAITGQGKTLGNVAMTAFDTCINQHLAYASFHGDEATAEYVLYYLQTRYSDLRSVGFAGGSTKGALTCGFLKTYPIPLPSVDEQREISLLLRTLSERISVTLDRRAFLVQFFDASLNQLMTGTLAVTPLLENQPNAHA